MAENETTKNEFTSLKEYHADESKWELCFYGESKYFKEGGGFLDEPIKCCTRTASHSKDGESMLPVDDSDCEKCKKFKSKFIEFPLTIDDILFKGLYDFNLYRDRVGSFVAVRPCGAEYENKTYVGILVGDLPTSIAVSLNHKSNDLKVFGDHHNPCIVVPSLGKIVWGYESWWHLIEKPEALDAISDEDIEGTWYVKALSEMMGVSAKDVIAVSPNDDEQTARYTDFSSVFVKVSPSAFNQTLNALVVKTCIDEDKGVPFDEIKSFDFGIKLMSESRMVENSNQVAAPVYLWREAKSDDDAFFAHEAIKINGWHDYVKDLSNK